MTTTDTPRFPWGGIDPAEWLRTWQTVWRVAPDSLVQPILPGWTFNINSSNSSSPQTEADVVARHSYGRQIGRMADALELVIVDKFGKAPRDTRLAEFLDMKHEIDEIKKNAAAARVEQLTKDLALLKERDEGTYVQLRDALREALGRS